MLKKNPLNEIKNLYSEMNIGVKRLVTPIDMSDEEYVANWLAKTYTKKEFADNYPEYYTAKGERVRSKSEILIADALDRAGVPYKYECPLKVGQNIYHPDFTTLNVRERKVKILEHLGMMDDRSYSNNAIRKLNDYEKAGYVLGKDLIISYETANCPINMRQIDNLIKNYLK